MAWGGLLAATGWAPAAAAQQSDLTRELREVRLALLLDTPPTSLTHAASGEIVGTGEMGTTTAPSPWTAEQELRMAKIASCLAIYYQQPVDADKLRPWSIMHGLIAFEQASQTIAKGQAVNTIDYLCHNGVGDGMQILYLQKGQIQTRQGPGVQGHEGQLLAILAQCGVPASQPLTIEGKSFTLQDLIEFEKRGCESGKELTFKLLGLTHYVDPHETWRNHQGETWSLARLLKEELAQPLSGGACGGTHRLMALSHAVATYRGQAAELTGDWLKADAYLDACFAHTFKLQNTDGSFSTKFFAGRDNNPNLKARLYSTGHILEWMAYALPAERLHDPAVTAAVDFLVDLMLEAPGHALDVGPRGHALHALMMYEQRAFGIQTHYWDTSLIREFPKNPDIQHIVATPAQPATGTPATPANYNPTKRGILRRR